MNLTNVNQYECPSRGAKSESKNHGPIRRKSQSRGPKTNRLTVFNISRETVFLRKMPTSVSLANMLTKMFK